MLPTALLLAGLLTPDRDRAADLLETALADPAATAESLREAGGAARDTLADSRFGQRLDRRLDEADDPRIALQEALEELRFEPVLEGDMPVGWPVPTALEEIELKRYPVTRLARAEMVSSSYGPFMSLFRHITERDIPMTVPVEMEMDASGGELRESTMGFLYQGPNVGRIESDGTVEVLDLEPATFLSLGQRGRTSPVRIAAAIAELRETAGRRGDLELTGAERVLEYNGPGIRGLRRYYEVQVEVRDRAVARFSAPREIEVWRTVDDRVMGGVSRSAMRPSGRGTGSFAGNLSLDNNGGFCSVRTTPADWLPAGADELVLFVRGDGRTYDLRLRTNDRFDGPSYGSSFTPPAGEWAEVRLPLSGFRCTFRGRPVEGAPPLEAGAVRQLGLLIGSKQEGEFALEIGWIAAVEAVREV